MVYLDKIKDKIKFYSSLNHEFASLRNDVSFLKSQLNLPPWLPLFNQDRFRLMEKLEQERATSRYKSAFTANNPLVSVRIATYNNSSELINRAIPSVFNQTYKNIELVIVGDYCTDDTEEKIKKLNHPKIRYTDLSYHYPYPENQLERWMAQGLLAHNEASKLAKGLWIAPLDDDNEFLPYHIEILLEKAKKEKLELVYGNMISIDRDTGARRRVGGFPPQVGNFDFSACIYHYSLKNFPFDINSFHYAEVGDVNLMRRFKESGVRMGFVNRYVTNYYFRQPGSPRTRKVYPQKKETFKVLNKLQDISGKLSMNSADLLMDTIRNSNGKILLVYSGNQKLRAFVKEAVTLTGKRRNLGFLKLQDKVRTKSLYDLIIMDSKIPVTAKSLKKYLNILQASGLLFSTESINRLAGQLDNSKFFLVEENIIMKI